MRRDPKGKNQTQEIDIYYKGIEALEMSKVTASMEKMRKRYSRSYTVLSFLTMFSYRE